MQFPLKKTLIALLMFSTISQAAKSRFFPPVDASCEELLAHKGLVSFVTDNINAIFYGPQWAATSTMVMIELMKAMPHTNIDFDVFEKIFRQENIPLYLIANPEIPVSLKVGLPKELKDRRTVRMKHFLWVGIKGEQEALALKRHLGLTDEENLRLLKETGVLLQIDSKKN